MRPCNIRLLGAALGPVDWKRVAWLAEYDPEANHGHGRIVATKDRERAMVFDTAGDALRCYQQVPACHPWRPDGKPNRPLTAYTVEVIPTDSEPMQFVQ
jgi:hypothetical protein